MYLHVLHSICMDRLCMKFVPEFASGRNWNEASCSGSLTWQGLWLRQSPVSFSPPSSTASCPTQVLHNGCVCTLCSVCSVWWCISTFHSSIHHALSFSLLLCDACCCSTSGIVSIVYSQHCIHYTMWWNLPLYLLYTQFIQKLGGGVLICMSLFAPFVLTLNFSVCPFSKLHPKSNGRCR